VKKFFGEQADRLGIEVEYSEFGYQVSYELFVAEKGADIDELLKTNFRVLLWYDVFGQSRAYFIKYIQEKGYKLGDFIFFTINPYDAYGTDEDTEFK
jgi:hypothetical protein